MFKHSENDKTGTKHRNETQEDGKNNFERNEGRHQDPEAGDSERLHGNLPEKKDMSCGDIIAHQESTSV